MAITGTASCSTLPMIVMYAVLTHRQSVYVRSKLAAADGAYDKQTDY